MQISIDFVFYGLITALFGATLVGCYFIVREDDAPRSPMPEDFARRAQEDALRGERFASPARSSAAPGHYAGQASHASSANHANHASPTRHATQANQSIQAHHANHAHQAHNPNHSRQSQKNGAVLTPARR